jgi:hypothetical protein
VVQDSARVRSLPPGCLGPSTKSTAAGGPAHAVAWTATDSDKSSSHNCSPKPAVTLQVIHDVAHGKTIELSYSSSPCLRGPGQAFEGGRDKSGCQAGLRGADRSFAAAMRLQPRHCSADPELTYFADPQSDTGYKQRVASESVRRWSQACTANSNTPLVVTGGGRFFP